MIKHANQLNLNLVAEIRWHNRVYGPVTSDSFISRLGSNSSWENANRAYCKAIVLLKRLGVPFKLVIIDCVKAKYGVVLC